MKEHIQDNYHIQFFRLVCELIGWCFAYMNDVKRKCNDGQTHKKSIFEKFKVIVITYTNREFFREMFTKKSENVLSSGSSDWNV